MLEKQKIKAIFFDQDRTLATVQSNNIYQQLTNLAAELFSLGRETLYIEVKNRLESGRGSNDPQKARFAPILKKIIVENCGKLDEKKWTQIENLYYSLISDSVTINPGVLEFLEVAKQLKLLLFIFTEDDRKGVNAKSQKLGLTKYFDEVLTLNDVGVMKPNLLYYLNILEKYALNWQDCIFVGDKWEKDCSIPKAEGGITVLFGTEDERADFCIKDMRELLKIIEEINAAAS